MNTKANLLKTLIREEVKKQLRSQRLNESKNDMKDWKEGMWVQYKTPAGKMHQATLKKQIDKDLWIAGLDGHEVDATLPYNELWSQLQFPTTLSSQRLAISGPTRNLNAAAKLYVEMVKAIIQKKTDMKNDPKFNWSARDIGEKVVNLVYVDYKPKLANIGWVPDIHHAGFNKRMTIDGISARLVS